ncbi:LysR substrate-binding domain-containing protein [Epibacterium sp. Ofav1-8]|uniref:LysR substrate-binding domain-containing protein n=1 Tax=Epibacterium sp. Ofav1-8 TaxID=2917735 RepID=UPI001EF68AB3|nr:LysR substrate-binding domain-containing protein [Epibacterium sp. Ofav1-8]MCG7621844.1 LysR substrate-binding domain-containing protein [Epibacterium sp. Ofav1-8]
MWSQVPPLQSLKLFDAVARSRSMTHAAAEAGISQSAVSQSIRQLEDFVQVPLLDRSCRPMQLTEEGALLHRACFDTLGRLAEVVEELRRAGQGTDTVTLSCNLGFATYWLMPRLNAFSVAHPEITVNVMATFQGAPGVQPGTDVAIRYGDGGWTQDGWVLLFRETIAPVCAPRYLECAGAFSGPEALARQRLIHVSGTGPDWPGWESYFRQLGHAKPALQCRLRFSNYVQAVQTALTGEGVMLGWRSVAGDLLRTGQLCVAGSRPLPQASGYHLRAAPGSDRREAVQVFLDWLRTQAAETPDLI